MIGWWISWALAQEPYTKDGPPVVLVPAELLVSAIPEYPPVAQQRKQTGTVVVKLHLDDNGATESLEVIRSISPELDAAALQAAKSLRWAPATRNGLPVASDVEYGFAFALKVEDQQGNMVPGSVQIVIHDLDDLPVPGAMIDLTSADGQHRQEQADDDGKVWIDFLPEGKWKVNITQAGFAPTTLELNLSNGETRSFALELVPDGPAEELVIFGVRQRWREVTRAERKPEPEPIVSAYELTRRDVESTAGALEDVNRAVHKLPGVVSDGDLLSNFSVRGFTAGEVTFELDRVPLDNPYHLAGFNSIFNPDMMSKVQFFATGAPSSFPDTTSAVMSVESWDGMPKDDRHDLDGAIEVSMSSARLLLMGPIGKGDKFTVAVAARRSYLEAYFGLMKAVNLLDRAVAAPEYDEISLRTAWRPGNHRLLLSFMRAGDHLALVDSDDESKVTINGTFKIDSVLYLASLDHRYIFENGGTVQTTVGFTSDSSSMFRDFAGSVQRDTERLQGSWRTDADLPVGEHHRVQFGGSVLARHSMFDGPVDDLRTTPPWTALPLADRGLDQLELSQTDWSPRIAGYLEHRYTGVVRTRTGLRTTYVARNGELLWSPSAGISLPLPTATIPKIAGGLYHHVVDDPLATDPVYGNPKLDSEKAAHLVIGIDQGLPIGDGGLLRLEGYYSKMWDLVVNPDQVSDNPYRNEGTGINAGIDALFAARLPRWQFSANFSWIHARRHNPLHSIFPTDYVPGHVQTLTAGTSVEFQVSPRWRLSVRYDFHTGRPMSQVAVNGDSSISMIALNDDRLKPFHQIDLRAEWRKATKGVRWSVYIEVLNATYFRSPYLPIVTVEEGKRVDSMLSHLPTRPFVGVRADF